jgi:hypothetical protein
VDWPLINRTGGPSIVEHQGHNGGGRFGRLALVREERDKSRILADGLQHIAYAQIYNGKALRAARGLFRNGRNRLRTEIVLRQEAAPKVGHSGLVARDSEECARSTVCCRGIWAAGLPLRRSSARPATGTSRFRCCPGSGVDGRLAAERGGGGPTRGGEHAAAGSGPTYRRATAWMRHVYRSNRVGPSTRAMTPGDFPTPLDREGRVDADTNAGGVQDGEFPSRIAWGGGEPCDARDRRNSPCRAPHPGAGQAARSREGPPSRAQDAESTTPGS